MNEEEKGKSTQVLADPPGNGGRFTQFDGLRGVAIIIVVLSHCSILNQGGVANAIFFALTGFLLLNPFKDSYEQRFLSIRSILKFYGSKALRILPAYYLVLLFIRLQTGYDVIPRDTYISLLYFGNIYGHLWYVYAFFWVMYIIPFVFVAILLLAKNIKALRNDLVVAVVFILLAAAARLFFLYTGMFDLRFDQLMLGIAAGYIFRYIRKRSNVLSNIRRHSGIVRAMVITIVLLIVITSSDVLGILDPSLSEYYIGWNLIYTVGSFMSLLVLLIALCPDGLIGRVLQAKPLLFVGKYTYTIYLLNSFIIPQLNIRSKLFLFVCVFSASLFLACLIDSLLDRVIGMLKRLVRSMLNKSAKASGQN